MKHYYNNDYYKKIFVSSTQAQLEQGGLLAGNVIVNQILNYIAEYAAKVRNIDEDLPIPTPIVSLSPDGYETLGVSIPIEIPDTPLILTVDLTFTGNVPRQEVTIDGQINICLGPLCSEITNLSIDYDHINNLLTISGMINAVILESLLEAIPGLNILLTPFLPLITPLAALVDIGLTLELDFNYHEGSFYIDLSFDSNVKSVIEFVCEHIFHARITTSSLEYKPIDETLYTSRWITDAFNTVVHGVENVASTVARGVDTAAHAVAKEAVNIGKDIENVGKTALHDIEYVGEKVWSGLKDAISWIDNAIKTLGEDAIKIWNVIKNALKSLSVDSVCNFLAQTHKIGPFNFNLPGSTGSGVPKNQPTIASSGSVVSGANVLWGYKAPAPLTFNELTSYCKQNKSQTPNLNQLRFANQNSTEINSLINMTKITGSPKSPNATIDYAFCYGEKPSFVQNSFIALNT